MVFLFRGFRRQRVLGVLGEPSLRLRWPWFFWVARDLIRDRKRYLHSDLWWGSSRNAGIYVIMIAALFSSSKDAFLLYSLKGNFLEFMWKASRGIVQELVWVLLFFLWQNGRKENWVDWPEKNYFRCIARKLLNLAICILFIESSDILN